MLVVLTKLNIDAGSNSCTLKAIRNITHVCKRKTLNFNMSPLFNFYDTMQVKNIFSTSQPLSSWINNILHQYLSKPSLRQVKLGRKKKSWEIQLLKQQIPSNPSGPSHISRRRTRKILEYFCNMILSTQRSSLPLCLTLSVMQGF